MITLSKSEYLMYLKHPTWLWLKKHDKNKLPEPDANLQAMFDTGNLFETFAEKRFEDIARVGFENYQEYLSMPDRTKEVMAGGATVLSQARFEVDFKPVVNTKLTCICDVIERIDDTTLDLYEIKSSTKVKPEHLADLSFQLTVLELAGYTVRNIAVIFCNNQYTRQGEIDPLQLATHQDVTRQVFELQAHTKRNIEAALQTCLQEEMPDPTPRRVKMGAFKEWMQIYQLIKPVEDKYSIYNLYSPAPEQLGQLEDMHITNITDIPSDFHLKPKQSWQVEATKLGEPLIDQNRIKNFLDTFTYPLYFLDYETLSSIVPPFDGLRPYQQLPFQYSLHILDKPDGNLQHKEFLHSLETCPIDPLLEQLQSDIDEIGTVLVWSEGFEKSCNDLMGQMRPEYATFLEGVNTRVKDLMLPFAKGWYKDKDFFGSASIKKVLPVLAPELSYGDMDISEGATAQRLWMQSVLDGAGSEEEKNKLMEQLRAYCELDTYAMVKVFEFLVAITKGESVQTSSADPTLEQQSLF